MSLPDFFSVLRRFRQDSVKEEDNLNGSTQAISRNFREA